jgi:K+ transporter
LTERIFKVYTQFMKYLEVSVGAYIPLLDSYLSRCEMIMFLNFGISSQLQNALNLSITYKYALDGIRMTL